MPAIFVLLEKDEGERFNKFDCAGDQASPSDHSVAPAPRSQTLFEVPPDASAPPSEWFFGNSVYQSARAQNAKTPARQLLCQPRESIASLKSTKDAIKKPGPEPTRAAAPPVEPTHTATSTQAKPAQAKKSSTSKLTLAGKEYSRRTRRCDFTKSLREQLPPSPDGKRKHRYAEFFSDLMRVQVVIRSIEAKVPLPTVPPH
ncbi:hypothetical protein MVLG_06013 [Microbotryum lychnidis-dioicae p1A1 Lamole]|uniref:Uncharacterized protein n=1 Tax=Microbotryum lychnidis-dioicae (strain p1A1 Lamole / MvSl-1064) TaxID=683840 RepID=U5HFZ1_USTV1|nr:hypothetical protein MVLG_06013 [Microbotryum lychnidis-dioicae p1A1 Lamole]|eukprot:KDE03500.1 hypothetical protein MVLG_06013 [Microbotryum lychnidis-dioicae p1A1 Lamole]